jgi:hypothetical protein
VNAGSFSPDAQERYFNKLKPMYGANARLIPGNDLVALDRWASINQQAMLAETLAGMVAEIRSNHSRLATDIVPTLQAYVGSPQTTPSPGVRLRDVALGQYLARPIDSLTTDYKAVSDYFDQGRALNLLLDRLVSAGNQQQKIKDANQVINIAPKYVQWGDEIAASARALLQQLGPISGL